MIESFECIDENNRLLNELIFTKKCLKLFFDFKTFIDLISLKFKSILIANELIEYKKLCERFDDIFRDKNLIFVKPKPIEINERKVDSNSVNLPEVCDNISIAEPPKNANHNKKNETKLKTYSRLQPKSVSQIASSTEPKSNENDNKNEPKIKTYSSLRLKSGSQRSSETLKTLKNWSELEITTEPNVNPNDMKTGVSPMIRIIVRKKNVLNKLEPKSDSIDFKPIPSNSNHNSLNGSKKKYWTYNTNDKDLPIKCRQCCRGFRSKPLFYSHYRRVHELLEQPLVCTIDGCNRLFHTEQAFNGHQRMCHLIVERYSCDQTGCQYKCSSLKKLNRHKKRHSLVCPVCGYQCRTSGGYQTHMDNSHATEPNHRCPHEGCGKAFRTKLALHVHTKCSHSEKKYHCSWPGCDYTCRVNIHLTNHSKTHVPDSLPCDWPGCTYIGRREKSLKAHKDDVHFGQRKYICDWPQCDKSYKRSSHLKVHMKTHHGNY